MKKIVILLLLAVSLNASVSVANGKTFFYTFDKVENAHATVDGKKVDVVVHPTKKGKYLAIVPTSYRIKKKSRDVKVYSGKEIVHSFSLHVKSGDYKKESLHVNPKHVKPPKRNNKKISKEYHEAVKIYNSFTKKRYLKTKFILPIKSKITSAFGNARVFNNKLASYHSGVDFRAKVGTPIKAINDGVVVLAKDRYYAGGSVIVDHGRGIYSCYYHI